MVIVESLLSVEDSSGFFIVAVATVWLSWSVKYIKKILGNLALRLIIHRARARRSKAAQGRPSTPDTPLLPRTEPTIEVTRKNAIPLGKIIKETSGIRDLSWEIATNKNLDRSEWISLVGFTFVVAFCGMGMIIGGILSADIRSVGPVRMDSQVCGLWLFDGETRSDLATRAGLNDLAKEERAAQYADNCYRQQDGVDKRRCSLFYRENLPYGSADFSRPCPFKGDICSHNITVTFESPLIDASEIGINSPSTHKFRRTTKCAPLRMDERFIKKTIEDGRTTYTYFYGEKPGGTSPVNYTYRTVGDPWDRLAPVYDVL